MKIYLALPSYDEKLEIRAFEAVLRSYSQGVVFVKGLGGSLLAYTFNQLYCDALNKRVTHGVTHFLMLHSDIMPLEPSTWIETLKVEMLSTEADALGAIVPLKSEQGVTSTALDCSDPAKATWAVRRLTMSDVFTFHETFTRSDLLLNTGCLLLDITKPWAEKVHFEINDAISQRPDGTFMAHVEPEDWYISKQIKALGGKLYATRKVKLSHIGRHGFENTAVWGSETSDPVYEKHKDSYV